MEGCIVSLYGNGKIVDCSPSMLNPLLVLAAAPPALSLSQVI